MKIVTLSRKPSNVIPLIESIRRNEPGFDLSRVIVVADGPVEQWEQLPELPTVLHRGDRPFIFARNANDGIKLANDDVILINDDTELMNQNGFSKMAHLATRNGITSAKVTGPWSFSQDVSTSFVCVFIPKKVQDTIGLLDERFVFYGYEDNNYCDRVKAAGLRINVCEHCVVQHFHPDRSTFHGPKNLYAGDNLVIYDRIAGIERQYEWSEHRDQLTPEELAKQKCKEWKQS